MMEIIREWSTPVAHINLDLPERSRKSLIQVIANACARETGSKSIFDRTVNINHDTLNEFEIIFDDLIRYYLSNAYGLNKIDKELRHIRIDARAYGFNTVSINEGGYNKPLRNHEWGFDGTLVYCVTSGGEYYLGKDNYPYRIKVPQIYTSKYTIQTPLYYQGDNGWWDGDSKWDIYNMRRGDILIYPSYCWGGSAPFVGTGIQSHLYINYRAITTKTHSRNSKTRDEHSFPSY